jgi:hypothetical protein
MNDGQRHYDEHGAAPQHDPPEPNDASAATVTDGLFAIASAIELLTEAVQHAADTMTDSAWKARLS